MLQADVGPGMRVLEAGVGSGALSMTLLARGCLDHGATRSERTSPSTRSRTCTTCSATDVDYSVQIRDVTQGIDEVDLDRVILDMPEPWDVVKHAEAALRPGGILLCVPAHDQPDPAASRGAGPALLRTRRDRGDPCVEPGTSMADPCVPTTGWWRTRDFSPRPGDSSGALESA